MLRIVARLIDADDIGFNAPPLFYELWNAHCDAVEAGRLWESPVVGCLEESTRAMLLTDLKAMARAEEVNFI